MTVSLNLYRWTVGVFNICKLPLKKVHGSSLQKNTLKTHLIEIVVFLIVLTVRYAISLSSAQNIRFLRRSIIFHERTFLHASCVALFLSYQTQWRYRIESRSKGYLL